ncbi:MAG: transcription-repair coupling factor [Polyangiaceae bacterium]
MNEAIAGWDDASLVPAVPEDRPTLPFAELAARALGSPGPHAVVHAEGCSAALLARNLVLQGAGHVVVVAADADGMRLAADDLEAVASLTLPGTNLAREVDGDTRVLRIPTAESLPWAEVHSDRKLTIERVGSLAHIAAERAFRFAVVTPSSLLRKTVPRQVLAEACVELENETEVDVTQLAERLTRAGYLRTPVVEDPGSFAIRGGVLDVWSPQGHLPARAELYGDLIISLKHFDPEDQRSKDDVPRVWLPPCREAILSDEVELRARTVLRELCDAENYPSSKARTLIEQVAEARVFFGAEAYLPAYYELQPLWQLLPADTVFVVEDPERVVENLREELTQAQAAAALERDKPRFDFDALYVDEAAVARAAADLKVVLAHRSGVLGSPRPDSLDAWQLTTEDAPSVLTRAHPDPRASSVAPNQKKSGLLDGVLRRLRVWHDAGLFVVLTARTETQSERLRALLEHRSALSEGDVQVVTSKLARGVIAPTERLVLLTEEEIFGRRTHRRVEKAKSARAALEDLRALAVGDYVVHVEHGIGRYLGLQKKDIGGVSVELLVVEYSGGKLFLPVYRMNQVQKYSGGEGAPKVDRLGGQSFAKTKAKVQKRVRQMADELLKLYAERNALTKYPLEAADDDYFAFEATFPYEETRDQAAAIAEVLKDLEQERVMDRLVCGDVGFGKTEVALRAAFRVAMAGRQVALLCPTTVLAQQHFNTFSSRLAGYPIEVRMLSRFVNKKQQTETIRTLRDGTVDILIGTHRVLSKDVHFANLGLLIVDEEQRFGVTHKERIKQLRASVDVLTLTATPIPRTLQLAIGGLRDMSLITTPPVDRRSIRTLTSRWDDEIVRDAILRELSRGGQVFFVYNRIEGLYERAERIKALVPEARVVVGHGQMSESALEKTMLDFVAGRFDVLASTAIIESGLDIPRANTMLIDRADLFGLSQLYQLRGRVGRSSERAYCYLLVPAPDQVTDDARSRLESLERHTDLGAGFQIATLDMELRGAGDLLGAEQSGFVASVGFDLFCQMLEEATHELRGEVVVHEVEPELSFDVDGLIPDDYVSDVGLRLSFYKRLSSAADEAAVAETAAELEDRFGPPPREAKNLFELMRLKTELRRLRVLGCEATAQGVTLHLRDDTPLDPGKVGLEVAKKKSPFKLSPDGRLTRKRLESEPFANGLVALSKTLDELTALERD